MPTIRELLKEKPQKIDNDLGILFGSHYSHVPEIAEFNHGHFYGCVSPRIEIVYYHYRQWDYRRYQALYGVRLDGFMVMICQNAGREGDDSHKRFVINGSLYRELVCYLQSIIVGLVDGPEEIALDAEIDDLYNFYGHDVRDRYDQVYW